MSLHMNCQAAKGFNGYAMQHQTDSKYMYVLTHVCMGKLCSPRLNMFVWPMLLSKFWFESMRHSANVTKQKGMDSIAKNSNVVHQMQDFIHLVLESIHSVLILDNLSLLIQSFKSIISGTQDSIGVMHQLYRLRIKSMRHWCLSRAVASPETMVWTSRSESGFSTIGSLSWFSSSPCSCFPNILSL